MHTVTHVSFHEFRTFYKKAMTQKDEKTGRGKSTLIHSILYHYCDGTMGLEGKPLLFAGVGTQEDGLAPTEYYYVSSDGAGAVHSDSIPPVTMDANQRRRTEELIMIDCINLILNVYKDKRCVKRILLFIYSGGELKLHHVLIQNCSGISHLSELSQLPTFDYYGAASDKHISELKLSSLPNLFIFLHYPEVLPAVFWDFNKATEQANLLFSQDKGVAAECDLIIFLDHEPWSLELLTKFLKYHYKELPHVDSLSCIHIPSSWKVGIGRDKPLYCNSITMEPKHRTVLLDQILLREIRNYFDIQFEGAFSCACRMYSISDPLHPLHVINACKYMIQEGHEGQLIANGIAKPDSVMTFKCTVKGEQVGEDAHKDQSVWYAGIKQEPLSSDVFGAVHCVQLQLFRTAHQFTACEQLFVDEVSLPDIKGTM